MTDLIAALERRTLNAKLILGFATLFLIILGIGFESLYSQFKLKDNAEYVYENGMIGLRDIKDLQRIQKIGLTIDEILNRGARIREENISAVIQAYKTNA